MFRHARAVATLAALGAVACGTRTPLFCEAELRVSEGGSIHFVVDRSNSMNEGGRWDATRTALGDIMRSLDGSVRASVTLFPGGDGEFGCGTGVRLGPSVSAANGAAAAAFLDASRSVRPGGGTPTARTLRALLPQLRAARREEIVHVVLATDGGPNCSDTVTSCAAADCTLNIESRRAECSRDGARNCCIDNASACLDDADTERVLREYSAAGIAVYVIGVTEIPRLRSALDAMARAAGTAGADGTAYFARGDGLESLRAVLAGVLREIATSCSVPLERAPQLTSMRVDLGEERARPGDVTHGFTLEANRLLLHGAACEARRAGAPLRVRWLEECQ